MANKLMNGNWYKFKHDGTEHVGQYIGRQCGFECCVCGNGCRAHTFNIWYDPRGGYETWGFGNDHMPEIIEDLGSRDDVVIDG